MWRTIDIVPSSIANDPQVQAACEAIDRQIAEIYTEIPSICFLPFVDQQVPPLLDVLAWEMHVDVWQGWSGDLDVDTKRALINQSIDWHQHKGTKWAVEQMLATVFKDGYVTEWYEYGGNPYFFQIITKDPVVDVDKLKTVIQAIYAVKNERSWLEGFLRLKPSRLQLYIAIPMTVTVNRYIPVSTNQHS